MNKGKSWTKVDKVKLNRLYNSGKSNSEISKAMDRTESAIRSALKKYIKNNDNSSSSKGSSSKGSSSKGSSSNGSSSNGSSTNIYVLQCENGKYYVGKTVDLYQRFHNHFTGNGCVWTKKYKPIDIEEIIKNCDDFDEDKYTKQYMFKYGFNNVRGGSYCQIDLNIAQPEDGITLEHSSDDSSDSDDEQMLECIDCGKIFISETKFNRHRCDTVCKKCGRKNNYTSKCYAKTNKNGSRIK